MKDFLVILKKLKSYWLCFVLNFLFNILFSFFAFFSLALVAPFLSLLFGLVEPVLEKPELTLSANAIIDWFYYQVGQIQLYYSSFGALVFVAGLFVVATFFSVSTKYMAAVAIIPARSGLVKNLRNDLYTKSLTLPLSFFSEQKKGDLIARMSVDAWELEYTMVVAFQNILKEPVNIIIFIIALLAISPGLLLFVLLVIPPTAYIIDRISRSLKRNSEKGQLKISALITTIEETISGMRVIKSFNLQDFVQQKFEKINHEYTKFMNKIGRRKDLADPLTEIIIVIAVVFIIWYGGNAVLNKELSGTALILFIILFFRLIPPAKSFTSAIFNLHKARVSLNRIMDIVDAPDSLSENPQPVRKADFNDEILFRNVCFAYNSNPDKIVLDHINITIKKGEIVALVGPSGAGKTTIADLIPRFYDPIAGEVLIDNTNVKDMKVTDLRALSAIVSQHCILFNDSIFNNIAFGLQNVSQQEVEYAAKIANAHEFILQLPEGYNTNVGDAGVKLSGGQRQRISIARAVLKKAPILILDEATSALDNESEKLVQQAFNKLMKEHTSIIIAHRLSTIKDADKIIVIEQGKIVETGSHSTLMTQNGLYKNLVELQSFA